MAPEEFVIADHEIDWPRVAASRDPDVIDARLVIVNKEARPLAIIDVIFYVNDRIVFFRQKRPNDEIHQGEPYEFVWLLVFSVVQLLLQR